jgi:hypothetical protein
MTQLLLDIPLTCLIALLLLVALTHMVDRIGLIAWLAWLDRLSATDGACRIMEAQDRPRLCPPSPPIVPICVRRQNWRAIFFFAD